jgi:Right handed beta helix region
VICVHAGTYSQTVRCDPEDGGAVGSLVTLKGYPGEAKPVLSWAGPQVVRIECSWFRLEGFDIAGPSEVGGANIYPAAGSHVEIIGNLIHGSICQGVSMDATTSLFLIERNRVYDNGHGCDEQAHGLYVQGTGHLVANNIVYNHTEGYGIQAYPSGSASVFAENTIVDNARGCFVLSYTALLVNNVCAFNGGFVSESGGAGCVISTNIRYQSGSNRPSACTFIGDITGDPLFVNRSGRNFHVQAGSPVIDAAQRLYFYSPDADNLVRPFGNGPDIGAFER